MSRRPEPEPEPEPYCDHGPFDACRCLSADLLATARAVYAAQRAVDGIGARDE